MIYVFGATNVDCLVKIKGKSRMYESNICGINFKTGGVGCNMARSSSNYKNTEFITVLNDFTYSIAKEELSRKNISIKYSLFTKTEDKCMYIDVLDEDGLVIGASDMSLFDNADLSFMDEVLSKITEEDCVILDANSRRVVEYVLNNSKGKKFIDAVSSVKLERIVDLLPKIYLIKANNFEYEFIKDIRKDGILITNGVGGTIILDGQKYEFSHDTMEPINPTGCGDTFFGAFVANFDKGIKEAMETAIKAAVTCSQIEESVPKVEDIKKYENKELKVLWK